MYPVLVKKAEAQVIKNERTNNENARNGFREFDEIELSPTEFEHWLQWRKNY